MTFERPIVPIIKIVIVKKYHKFLQQYNTYVTFYNVLSELFKIKNLLTTKFGLKINCLFYSFIFEFSGHVFKILGLNNIIMLAVHLNKYKVYNS